MQNEELIKELDPDYIRCWHCKRLIHLSCLEKHLTLGSLGKCVHYRCVDINECDNFAKIDMKERLRDVARITKIEQFLR